MQEACKQASRPARIKRHPTAAAARAQAFLQTTCDAVQDLVSTLAELVDNFTLVYSKCVRPR